VDDYHDDGCSCPLGADCGCTAHEKQPEPLIGEQFPVSDPVVPLPAPPARKATSTMRSKPGRLLLLAAAVYIVSEA